MAKQISELKKGDSIYDIDYLTIKTYKYVCIHPSGGGNYHILTKSGEDPIRMHKERLQSILDQDFKTWQETKLALADRFEESARNLRQEEISIE